MTTTMMQQFGASMVWKDKSVPVVEQLLQRGRIQRKHAPLVAVGIGGVVYASVISNATVVQLCVTRDKPEELQHAS